MIWDNRGVKANERCDRIKTRNKERANKMNTNKDYQHGFDSGTQHAKGNAMMIFLCRDNLRKALNCQSEAFRVREYWRGYIDGAKAAKSFSF